MTTLPNTLAANTGAMQHRPIGFLALWKSFNTLTTSSFTVQDTPLTAKSLLPKYKHSSLICLPVHYQTIHISVFDTITHIISQQWCLKLWENSLLSSQVVFKMQIYPRIVLAHQSFEKCNCSQGNIL
jgi:hypothetical protein